MTTLRIATVILLACGLAGGDEMELKTLRAENAALRRQVKGLRVQVAELKAAIEAVKNPPAPTTTAPATQPANAATKTWTVAAVYKKFNPAETPLRKLTSLQRDELKRQMLAWIADAPRVIDDTVILQELKPLDKGGVHVAGDTKPHYLSVACPASERAQLLPLRRGATIRLRGIANRVSVSSATFVIYAKNAHVVSVTSAKAPRGGKR